MSNPSHDMEDECYPAISMSTATNNTRRHIDSTSSSSTSSSSASSSSAQNSSNSITINLRNSKQQQQQFQDKHNAATQQSVSRCTAQMNTAPEIDIEECNIKDEPLSPSSSCPPSPNANSYGFSLNMANMAALTNTNLVFEHKNGSLQLSPTSQSLLKNQQIIFGGTGQTTQRIVIPKLNIKMEPQSSHLFGLPPTPPSSLPSDESEGNQSPEHHITSPMSPPSMQNTTISSTVSAGTATTATTTTRRGTSITTATTTNPASHINSNGRGYNGSSTRQPIHTPLISSQPKGSTGTLVLTEEEKRTLLAEGYPIPTRLPLTKAEEKSLKKIRRKIKNKISAQESRRKKKEYMDQLERKVEILVSENSDYRKRVESLEDSNASLLTQLAKLQSMLNKQGVKKA